MRNKKVRGGRTDPRTFANFNIDDGFKAEKEVFAQVTVTKEDVAEDSGKNELQGKEFIMTAFGIRYVFIRQGEPNLFK